MVAEYPRGSPCGRVGEARGTWGEVGEVLQRQEDDTSLTISTLFVNESTVNTTKNLCNIHQAPLKPPPLQSFFKYPVHRIEGGGVLVVIGTDPTTN